MCFSATASFTTSIILSVIGVGAIYSARTRKQYPFASIPLLFALQQMAEGFVWLSNASNIYFSYIFIIFAGMVWPMWIPWSLSLIETDPSRKRILSLLGLLGSAIALVVGYSLWSYPLSVLINEHVLYSFILLPAWISRGFALGLYCLAVIGPFFVMRAMSFKMFGIVLAFSAFISWWFWFQWFTSVWCFFAAILSVAVIFIIRSAQFAHNALQFIVINVLEPASYKDCHITGSINVPQSKLAAYAQQLSRTTEIVLYCANYQCSASHQSAQILKNLGFTNVKIYAGGIREWYQLKLPITGSCKSALLREPNIVDRPQDGTSVIAAEQLQAKIRKNLNIT